MPLFETLTDLQRDTDILRRRPYGVIEIVDDQFRAVHLRPWPKLVSVAEILWRGSKFHHQKPGNRCLLYYNQPLRFCDFLTLKYVVSTSEATFKTFRRSLIVLEEIARIKGSDALLCEASNLRISDRLLKRWGWESHVPNSRRRHFIKRFYGTYPEPQCAPKIEAVTQVKSQPPPI